MLWTVETVALSAMHGLLQWEFAQSFQLMSIRLTTAGVFGLWLAFFAFRRFG